MHFAALAYLVFLIVGIWARSTNHNVLAAHCSICSIVAGVALAGMELAG